MKTEWINNKHENWKSKEGESNGLPEAAARSRDFCLERREEMRGVEGEAKKTSFWVYLVDPDLCLCGAKARVPFIPCMLLD
jgi:hypothetical protein